MTVISFITYGQFTGTGEKILFFFLFWMIYYAGCALLKIIHREDVDMLLEIFKVAKMKNYIAIEFKIGKDDDGI